MEPDGADSRSLVCIFDSILLSTIGWKGEYIHVCVIRLASELRPTLVCMYSGS